MRTRLLIARLYQLPTVVLPWQLPSNERWRGCVASAPPNGRQSRRWDRRHVRPTHGTFPAWPLDAASSGWEFHDWLRCLRRLRAGVWNGECEMVRLTLLLHRIESTRHGQGDSMNLLSLPFARFSTCKLTKQSGTVVVVQARQALSSPTPTLAQVPTGIGTRILDD